MRFSTTLAAIAAFTISFTHAYSSGFNVGANNPDGSCKTTKDWEIAFKALRGLMPGNDMTHVRLYASSDCNTLANAVPAALSTGTSILVGIWTEDENHYIKEKNALTAAIEKYGSNWIIAISVGSEDLYKGYTDAATLSIQINDIREMVRTIGVLQPIGHTDTWGSWIQSSNHAVIEASDFIGLDSYPYWAGVEVSKAASAFWESVETVKSTVQKVSPGKQIWITETGWPVSGPTYGSAVASVENAQIYWSSLACAARESINFFWYAYQDFNESPSFGIIGSVGQTVYGGKC